MESVTGRAAWKLGSSLLVWGICLPISLAFTPSSAMHNDWTRRRRTRSPYSTNLWSNSLLDASLFNVNDGIMDTIIRPIEGVFPSAVPSEIYAIGISLGAISAIQLFAMQPPASLLTRETTANLVSGTFLEGKKLQRAYKASRDGWSALAFHEAVDGEGSGLVAVKGINGKIFGGYNPSGWRSTDDYFISSAAFLWCLKGKSVVKLPILPGGNCAVFDYATAGPTFGSTDFVVGPQQAAVMGGFAGPDTEDMTASAGNLRQCRSAIGTAYQNDQAWPARGTMRLVEVEVYCAVR